MRRQIAQKVASASLLRHLVYPTFLQVEIDAVRRIINTIQLKMQQNALKLGIHGQQLLTYM